MSHHAYANDVPVRVWTFRLVARPAVTACRIAFILFVAGATTACEWANERPVPPDVVTFLTGEWTPSGQAGSVRFYADGTVKILLPGHMPALRLVSQYEINREGSFNIALGGAWAEPATMEITNRKRKEIMLRLPNGPPVILHKQ